MVSPLPRETRAQNPVSGKNSYEASAELRRLTTEQLMQLLERGAEPDSANFSLVGRVTPQVSNSSLGFFGRVWVTVSRAFFKFFGMQRPQDMMVRLKNTRIFANLPIKDQIAKLESEVGRRLRQTPPEQQGRELLNRFSEAWVQRRLGSRSENLKTDLKDYLQGSKNPDDLEERLEVANQVANYESNPTGELRLHNRRETLPKLKNLTELKKLSLSSCGFKNLDALTDCSGLETLNIEQCHGIENLRGLNNCSGLKEINIKFCAKIKNLEGIGQADKLETLQVENCASLDTLEGFNAKNIKKFRSAYCNCLGNGEILSQMNKLESLEIVGNPLDNLELKNQKLQELKIEYISLNRSFFNSDLPELKNLSINGCTTEMFEADFTSSLVQRFPNSNINLFDNDYILGLSSRRIEFSFQKEDLEKNPKGVLEKLNIKLKEGKQSEPKDWSFKQIEASGESFAVDAGGVKRALVNGLLRNLFSDSDSSLGHTAEPPHVLPQFQKPEDKDNFEALGRLLYIPLRFPAPVGPLFDKRVFEGIARACSEPELLQDTPEARARLGALAYGNSLFDQLRREKDANLSRTQIDNLVALAELRDPELANKVRALDAIVGPDQGRTEPERETLAYLLYRSQDDLAALVQDPSGKMNQKRLEQLKNLLGEEGEDFCNEVSEQLEQAKREAEQSATLLKRQMEAASSSQKPALARPLKQAENQSNKPTVSLSADARRGQVLKIV